MTAEEPGWYADPSGIAPLRWWDGGQWTSWLSRDPDAAPPPVVPPPVAAPPATQAAPATPDAALDRAGDRPVRLPVAVAVVLGALLVAVVGLGAVASATADRLPGGPALPPPPAAAAAAVTYDPATRVAAVGELQVILAGRPYQCRSGPEALPPAFTSAELCGSAVHPDYDGRGSDWTATTGVGLVADELVVEGDLEATGKRVFGSLRSQFFAGQQTTVRDAMVERTDLTPAGRSVDVAGEVHYRVAGVPSRYDRLLVVVFVLADGRHAAFFSARPERTPASTLDVLNASIATLHVR